MKRILKHGINIDMLKTIALVAMVIDHVAFYFKPFLLETVYMVCRHIGRIAMPLFVYALVQGFFHTSNFKKYIIRLAICAIVTQASITVLMLFNLKYIQEYTAANWVYTHGNILFTFILSLLTMKILHEEKLVKKWTDLNNILLKITMMICILLIGILIPLDYGVEAIVLCVLMYYIEKARILVLIGKIKGSNSIKGIALGMLSQEKINVVYHILIFISLITVILNFKLPITTILSIIPIILYNFEKGNGNRFVRELYYYIYPIQHALLYSIALLIMLT